MRKIHKLLDRSIAYVKGVGEKRAQLFAKLGVKTVYDLLEYCPRDYIDLSKTDEITASVPNDEQFYVFRARVVSKMPVAHIRRGLTVCKAVFTDDTEDITIVLYNQEYAFSNLKVGDNYVLYGKVTGNVFRREMNSPTFFPPNSRDLLVPVYPLTTGLSQAVLRKVVKNALELIEGEADDFLTIDQRFEWRLCDLNYAWENVHFPRMEISANEARRRLIFNEFLIHSLSIGYCRINEKRSSKHVMKSLPLDEFLSALPYTLTNAQKKALDDCVNSMCANERMNRLIQGDVGSGKTAVAAGAAWFVYKNGCQSCVMAPTEILACQHYETFSKLLSPLGMKIGLLTGSLTPKNKRAMQDSIAMGEYDCVVGTHALFSENTSFKNLALVITDEQHRFGVEQRAALSAKGDDPHRIVMSATPIPRTLALILYGDLDISVINEMPVGRKPVTTYAVTGKLRNRAFSFVKKQLDSGGQGYIVCPAVDESGLDIIDAVGYFEKLSTGEFADYRLGLLHGKMNTAEKDLVMNRFKDGEIDLLVATTVVEVGVDVPNASIIVIENADRFGLSQLHQLRGRVGRGGQEAYCILISDNTSPENVKRMKTISSTSDGFKIAEEDLKLRGPGDFFGTHQHGLPSFKIADISRDMEMLEAAQKMSKRILDRDPRLKSPENAMLAELVNRLIEKGAEIN